MAHIRGNFERIFLDKISLFKDKYRTYPKAYIFLIKHEEESSLTFVVGEDSLLSEDSIVIKIPSELDRDIKNIVSQIQELSADHGIFPKLIE